MTAIAAMKARERMCKWELQIYPTFCHHHSHIKTNESWLDGVMQCSLLWWAHSGSCEPQVLAAWL